jgi:hypothetical protein
MEKYSSMRRKKYMKRIYLNETWIDIRDVLDDSEIIRFIDLVMGRNYSSVVYDDIIFEDKYGRIGYLMLRGLF